MPYCEALALDDETVEDVVLHVNSSCTARILGLLARVVSACDVASASMFMTMQSAPSRVASVTKRLSIAAVNSATGIVKYCSSSSLNT